MIKKINKLVLLLSVVVMTGISSYAQSTNIQYANTLPAIGAYPELCLVLNRTLKLGDTGSDVKRLQVVLGQEGIAYLSATGYYGNATMAAVKTFQVRNGIYPAGKVGPQTMRFMLSQWCSGDTGVIQNNNYQNQNINTVNYNNASIYSNSQEISIQPISSSANNVTLSWTSNGSNSCTISQDNGNLQSVQTVGQQIFTLFNESRFTFTCIGYNGRQSSKTIIVRPNQSTSGLPNVNVSINPTSIIVGQQATLYWTSSNASYCTSNVPNYTSNLQTSGYIPVTISTGNQSYTFTCYTQTGLSVSQTITANNTSNLSQVPVINNLTYSNNYIAWGTSNTNSCILSGGNINSQTVQTNGNQYVATPSTNTTWTLTCYGNNNQTVTRTVNYNVYTTCQTNNTCTNDVPTLSVTANPTSINSGQSTTLSFVGSGMTVVSGCTITGGTYNSTNVPVYTSGANYGFNGSIVVTPNVSTTYTVNCNNSTNGQTVTANVYVAVSATTQGNFTAMNNNGTVNLTWSNNQTNSSNQCSLYRHSTLGPTDGSYYDGSKILIAANLGNSGSYSTPYTATSGNWPAPGYMQLTLDCGGNKLFTSVAGNTNINQTVNIYANPANTTYSGQPVTLTWNSTNASYCNIYTGTTNLMNQPVNGSTTVYPTINTNYYATCYNAQNQSVQSNMAYVTVNGNNGGNVTVNISASPNPVANGQISNLSWYSSNASYCNIVGGNTNLSNQPASGSYAVSPAQSTNYTITCYNGSGQNGSAYVYLTMNGGNTGGNNTSLFITSNTNRNVNINVYKAPYNSCMTGYINWGDGTSNTNYTYPSVSYGSSCQIGVTHTYTNVGTYTITAYENNTMSASTQITVQ